MADVDAPFSFRWATPAGAMYNTGHLRYDEATLTPQAVAQSLRDAFSQDLRGLIDANYVVTMITVGDEVAGHQEVVSLPGGGGGDAAPPNICFGIRKIAAAGRNGKWFLPGVPEPSVTEQGDVTNEVRVAMATRLTAFLVALDNDGIAMTVKQKEGTYALVTSMVIQPKVWIQKRRYNRIR